MRKLLLVVAMVASAQAAPLKSSGKVPLDVRSRAIDANGRLGREYTCEGAEDTPPLSWSKAPPETQSFAVMAEDDENHTQWIVPTISKRARKLLHAGAWTAPCPTDVAQHYTFHVYALDIVLHCKAGTDRGQFLHAIDGHIVAHGELIATYATVLR
jgi:phosphatidylethanolamine-binding protein (PEBP) family uncharacterized protein